MVDEIENGFFKLLQADIIMTIGGRKYKIGRFLNFKIKEFYIQLDLVVNDKYKKVDIPFPFLVKCDSDVIIFSYKIADMGTYGPEILKMFQNTIGSGKSKLYDKELVIKKVI